MSTRFSLADCSPELQARILAKLKQQEVVPATKTLYCMAYTIGGHWLATDLSPNKAMMQKAVTQMCLATTKNAALTARGSPPAKLVEVEMPNV